MQIFFQHAALYTLQNHMNGPRTVAADEADLFRTNRTLGSATALATTPEPSAASGPTTATTSVLTSTCFCFVCKFVEFTKSTLPLLCLAQPLFLRPAKKPHVLSEMNLTGRLSQRLPHFSSVCYLAWFSVWVGHLWIPARFETDSVCPVVSGMALTGSWRTLAGFADTDLFAADEHTQYIRRKRGS